MRDLRSTFIRWYNNEFHQTEMFQKMNALAENSPWHREDSIGIHTDMVVGEFISNAWYDWDRNEVIGALACAFHDVGKPEASAINGIKWKPERGNYLSFGSHEQISARMWEDFAVLNWARLVELFDLTPRDIYAVAWIIEHHLPWAVKKDDKRNALAQTVFELDILETFCAVLVADTWGRISDDGPEKKAKVSAWLKEFRQLVDPDRRETVSGPNTDRPTLMVPIAASASGKSTFRQTLSSDTKVFSMDDLRIEMYLDPDEELNDEAYNRAYAAACEDKHFNQAVQNRFNELVATGFSIFCDNTNISARRRKHYLTTARRKGYHIQAILFPIALRDLIARQSTRADKTVPTQAVVQQYRGLQMPSYGDFDSVIVLDSNIK